MLNIYWGDINLILSDYVGIWINIILILFIIVNLPLLYNLLLLKNSWRSIRENKACYPRLINKILSLIITTVYAIFFSAIFYFLNQYTKLIYQLFEYYSIFILSFLYLFLIPVFYILLKQNEKIKAIFNNKKLSAKTKKVTFFGFLIVMYSMIYSAPLLFIPSNVLFTDLPSKPILIAHRGAAHLAPEDTIIAGQIAYEHGAAGWEIDVRISKDGKLFLLHDPTLTRTTNIREVFPDRTSDNAESFKWSELQKLDAGSWFAEKDPYGTIARGLVNADNYKNVKIPSLGEALNFSREHNFYVDIDTKEPPEEHPYAKSYFELVLDEILKSKIDLNKVMIITTNEAYINLIEQKNMTDVILGWDMGQNPSIEAFKNSKYDYELVATSDLFSDEEYREFYREKIPIIADIVDSPERFVQLWCLGVKFIMTNEVHIFKNIKEPFWTLEFKNYLLYWFSIYSISSAIVIIIILMNKKRKSTILSE
ncbi:MAG: glycerophosphodiester phosphodiesterase family protein [Promethearchaeia archaeon]